MKYFYQMENTIDLQEFLSSKRILHSETASDYSSGIRFLCENETNADIITYNYVKKFSLFGIDVLQTDKEGRYFYEYCLERIGDIVDNITVESSTNLNVELSYNIGGIVYTSDEVKEFVFISAAYHAFNIRITFLEKPNPSDEFKILSRYYLINPQDRVLLGRNRVNTENHIYNYGMCIKKNSVQEKSGYKSEHFSYLQNV